MEGGIIAALFGECSMPVLEGFLEDRLIGNKNRLTTQPWVWYTW